MLDQVQRCLTASSQKRLAEKRGVEIQPESRVLDVVPLEHPDFMGMLAVLLWVRSKGTNIGVVFQTPELMAEYLAARWTPLEVIA